VLCGFVSKWMHGVVPATKEQGHARTCTWWCPVITEKLVQVLLGLVGFLISLLPNDTVSWPEAESIGAFFGDIAGPFDVWLPITEVVAVTAITLTFVLPVMFVYRLSMWLWTLLPDSISGSGT